MWNELPGSARTEPPEGKSSPEELLAAAHASCYAMSLTAGLVRAGTPPEELHVSAQVTFDKIDDGWTVTASALEVLGRVPGASAEAFEAAAQAAGTGCPISRALRGNVEISVRATLEE